MNDQLKAQNNGASWRDCEAAGLKHQLGPAVEVRSESARSGVGTLTSTVRRCKRCPVSYMSVVRR